jgi:hypothetical protein
VPKKKNPLLENPTKRLLAANSRSSNNNGGGGGGVLSPPSEKFSNLICTFEETDEADIEKQIKFKSGNTLR